MNNNDSEGAKTFLTHAHKIFEEKLKISTDNEMKESRIDELWLDIYNDEFPTSKDLETQYCEKILSLSSIIFIRSTQHMTVVTVQ